jgi:hypothetical protein
MGDSVELYPYTSLDEDLASQSGEGSTHGLISEIHTRESDSDYSSSSGRGLVESYPSQPPDGCHTSQCSKSSIDNCASALPITNCIWNNVKETTARPLDTESDITAISGRNLSVRNLANAESG